MFEIFNLYTSFVILEKLRMQKPKSHFKKRNPNISCLFGPKFKFKRQHKHKHPIHSPDDIDILWLRLHFLRPVDARLGAGLSPAGVD